MPGAPSCFTFENKWKSKLESLSSDINFGFGFKGYYIEYKVMGWGPKIYIKKLFKFMKTGKEGIIIE